MLEKIEIIQENYEKILEIAKVSNSLTDLVKRLGWKNYHKRKKIEILLINNNFDLSSFPKLKSELSIFNNKEKLEDAIKNSLSYTEVIKCFVEEIAAGHYITLKEYIKKFELNTSHFSPHNYFSKVLNSKEIFVINSPACASTIRRRIIKDKLIPYKCKCGNEGCWQGQEMALQLDHKNGDRTDNRLKNLEFLCPNCHAITPTFGSKNKKSNKRSDQQKIEDKKVQYNTNLKNIKIKRIENSKEEIIKNIDKFSSYNDIMTEYNLIKNSQTNHGLKNLLERNQTKEVEEFLIRADRAVKYPDLELLISLIKLKGFLQVSKELGCSDNAIRSHLKKNGIAVKSIKKTVVPVNSK